MKPINLIPLILCLNFSSCMTVSHVVSMYVGDGLQQWYLQDTEAGDISSGRLNLDITFRQTKDIPSPATVNFSWHYAENGSPNLTKIAFVLPHAKEISLADLTVLYHNKAERTIRYTSKLPIEDLRALLQQSPSQIKLATAAGEITMFPSADFLARLKELNNEIN